MKVLLAILAIAGIFIAANYAYGANTNFHKYSSIKKLSDAIDDGKFDDDNINWNSFKSWNGFVSASEKIQHCIEKAQDKGQNLGDYEVYDCVD